MSSASYCGKTRGSHSREVANTTSGRLAKEGRCQSKKNSSFRLIVETYKGQTLHVWT